MNNLTPQRIFDHCLIGVVFCNFTNLYTFIAGLTGLSFKVVGVVFMLFMAAYCVVNWGLFDRFIKVRPALWFLLLFAFIPILTLVYAPYRELRYVAYTINFGMIFVVTGIWVMKYGWVSYSKFILLSWIICILGIVLSYFVPGVFERVALIQEQAAGGGAIWSAVEIAQSNQSRAFGFYMQANRAAHALIMHLVVLLPLYLHNRPNARIALLAISFGAVLLTGSRAGFLVMCGVSALMFFYELKNGVRTKAGSVIPGLVALPKYILLLLINLIVCGLVLLVSVSTDNLEVGGSSVTRIFESLFSSDYQLIEDSSVQARLQTNGIFIDRILDRPFWGRGHFSDEWGKYMGIIPITAHNMYLDLSYQYGIPLTLACYGLLFFLATCREARRVTDYFRANPLLILGAFIFVHSFVSSTTIDLRMFPSVMAFMLVMLYSRSGDGQGCGAHLRN